MTSKQRIKGLDAELTSMRAELAALEAAGHGDDLKAMFLRDGIPATEYLRQLIITDDAEPKRDMRFLSRNAPLRKKWRK